MHVEAGIVPVRKAHRLGAGEHLRGEGFVEFDQVKVLQRQPGALQRFLRGRNRADAHDRRTDSRNRPGDQPGERLQAVLVGHFARHHETGGGAVILAAGIAGGDGGFRILFQADSFQLSEHFSRRVRTRMFVARYYRVGLLAFDSDRDDLLVEHTALLGSDGFRMGGGRERVLRGAGDLVIAAKVLGRLQHAARHREILATSREAASDQAVVHGHIALTEAPAPVGGIKRRIAHRLSAARDNAVHRAGGDLHGRIDDRLQAGAATPVDLHAADFDRQARIERDHAA